MGAPRAGALPLLVAAAAAAIVAICCVATRVGAGAPPGDGGGPSAAAAAAAPPTKRYIVTLTRSAAPADAVRSAVRRVQARARAAAGGGGGAPALRVLDEYRTIGGLLVEGTPADEEAVRAMDGVLFVEEDGIVTAA